MRRHVFPQDAAALDGWVAGSFRPALLARLPGSSSSNGSSSSSIRGGAAATHAAAVGWVGRALALRNHAALGDVIQALLGVLAAAATATVAATATAAEAGAPTDMEVEGGVGDGPHAPARSQATAEAASAAAEAFGVLVAEQAASGGVGLPARPAAAVCRVLWQQRTLSLCIQVRGRVAPLTSHVRQAP